MSQDVTKQEELWSSFLQRWPIEKLPYITLTEYSTSGNMDSFVNWLESRTEDLGSIWGGSSFKFGIYSRKSNEVKISELGRIYDGDYAWYSKYGSTRQEAFERVRELIVTIAQTARKGNFADIESVDFGSVVKWKIAFLYQDKQNPQLLPIYKAEMLEAYLKRKQGASMHELQQEVNALRNGENILSFGRSVWETANKNLRIATLKPEDAFAYIQSQSDRFFLTEEATEKLAVYATDEEKYLALIRDSNETRLWLESGKWLNNDIQKQLTKIVEYSADNPKRKESGANIPVFFGDKPVILVTIPEIATLIALLDAYTVSDEAEQLKQVSFNGIEAIDKIPLNQILYGPPGTGKTYATIDYALEILDPDFFKANRGTDDETRKRLKMRFDELERQERIRFVTFHQSFSYEDFVEGLRADSDEKTKQLSYKVVPGVFKSICDVKPTSIPQQVEAPFNIGERRIWKMSLGNTLKADASIYQECIDKSCILLGYGHNIDYTGCTSRQDVEERVGQAGIAVEKPENDYGIKSVTTFVTEIKKGDLIVVSDGNLKFRAIGEVVGDYEFRQKPDTKFDYSQMRPVKWLREFKPSLPYDELLTVKFSQMTLYELSSSTIDRQKLQNLLQSTSQNAFRPGQQFGSGYTIKQAAPELLELQKPNGKCLTFPMAMLNELAENIRSGHINVLDIRNKTALEKLPNTKLDPNKVNGYNNILALLVEHMLQFSGLTLSNQDKSRVLIIDEINRGNVSRIFGELITLLEDSKRSGNKEALSVILPYSKEPFSIPNNLYIIATMNTVDRSLAGLDIALRRRFTFQEMPPKPELLENVIVSEEGKEINISQLLSVMNQRIEVLLDRDHRLGHAYFMPLRNEPSLARLKLIFEKQILPLLEEYFFEDWERVRWVLNDHKADENGTKPFIYKQETGPDLTSLFGKSVAEKLHDNRWELNLSAFNSIDSYRNIVS